jgi:hypothetical protein
VVAAATTALKIGTVTLEVIMAVGTFVAVLIFDTLGATAGRAAARSPDPIAMERSFNDAFDLAAGTAGLSAPEAIDLRWVVRDASRRAYETNLRSIARRRQVLFRMRLLVGVAVLAFAVAAIGGSSSSVQSSSAPSPMPISHANADKPHR